MLKNNLNFLTKKLLSLLLFVRLMRLTPDLLSKADVVLSPSHEVELVLRGNKIPAIENLGVTEDYYESIDLSDNEITAFENFPLLNRVRTIILNNNRVSRIAPNLGSSLPHIENLILTNNRINRLGDLDSLSSLTSLKTLSLVNNPVTKVKYYRIYVINLLPKLKMLDFSPVKWKERLLARKLFQGKDGAKVRDTVSSYQTFVPGEGPKQTAEDPKAKMDVVKSAIENATSLAEIQKLENALITGSQLPSQKPSSDSNPTSDQPDNSS